MKKLLYCAATLAMAFFSASCQQENLEPVANGGVTYTITLPEAVQTKGSNGYESYDLYYEVYKTVDATELATAQLLFEKKVTMTGNTTTIALDLLNDQDYTVLFWANKAGEAWFNTADLRNVEMVQSASNNNDRDAFCAKDELVNFDGAITKTVTLTRPFAQLNIATIVPVLDYDITPNASYVKVSNIPVAYNVATASPVGTAIEVEYTKNLVPTGKKINNEYDLVAMNYVLVPEGNVTVYYEIETANGTVKNTVNNVPLRKNYRTNILGNLLTSNATYTVELKPGFEEGEEVRRVVDNTEELATAVAEAMTGETIYIDGTVTMPYFTDKALTFIGLSEKAVVKQSPATHIDTHYAGSELNFKNLTLVGTSYTTNTQGYQKAVKETYTDCNFQDYIMFAGDETIVNNCLFTSNVGQYFWTGSADNITFNECTFNGLDRAVKVCTVGNHGERVVTFTGCEFNSQNPEKAAIEIDGTQGSSYVVNINGCTHTGFAAGANTGDTLFNVKGADNVKVYVNGSQWKGNGLFEDASGNKTVNSTEALKEALSTSPDHVNVKAGRYTFPASSIKNAVIINCEEGTVFTGTSGLNINGATVIGATFENKEGIAASGTIYGTFQNCTFDGSEALRWCYSTAGKDVVFEDCVIKTDFRGFHFDGMEGNVIFRRCQINGFNAYGGEGTATFENCVFGNDESGYNGLNTYSNTVLTGCQFNFISGKTNFIDMEGTGRTMTITNCTATLDGVAKPITDFVGGSKIAQNTVIIDDNECVLTAAHLTAVLAKDSKVITLAPGVTYEGTFHVTSDKKITSADADNKAMIKGRVHVNSANATFTNVSFDRNDTNSNEPNNTASNALQYKAVVMIYGDQTHTIKFEGCNFYNNNGTNKSAITNVACDLIVNNCYFEGYSSSIYSQANLSVTYSTFNYTGGNNVILSINGCGDNGGKVIFKNNVITNKIFALSQFLSTVGFDNGTYHFDVQGNTGAGFDYYFLNEGRVTNKTFAEGSVTF